MNETMQQTSTSNTAASMKEKKRKEEEEKVIGDENSGNKESKKERRMKRVDFSKQYTRQIALKIAYLGWNYDGFAAQDSTDNTIEAYIHSALQQTFLVSSPQKEEERKEHFNNPKTEYFYSRCGRTDRGVSAFGQVISIRVKSKLKSGSLGLIPPTETDQQQQKEEKEQVLTSTPTSSTAERNSNEKGQELSNEIDYCSIINSKLPKDIRVLSWAPVSPNFNARFDCKYRLYRYYLQTSAENNDGIQLDINKMKIACKYFVGEHDFRNFCRADFINVATFKRTIHVVDIETESGNNGLCCIVVKGSGFLWHQVRCMVSILVMIGRGEEEPNVIEQLLDIEKCPGKPSYSPADEKPLCLYECGFEPPLQFQSNVSALKKVWDGLFQIRSHAQIQHALTSSMMSAISLMNVTMQPSNNYGTSTSNASKVVMKLEDAKKVVQSEREKMKEEKGKGKRRRSLTELSAEAKTLEERIADLGPTKRKKYEERLEIRKKHAAEKEKDGQAFENEIDEGD